MIAFTPVSPTGAPQFATSDLDVRPTTHIVARAEPAPVKSRSFRFPQRIIPLDGGRTLLRLRENPTLTVNSRTMEFDVQDWGIHMRCDQVEDLPRQIARRFLTLFGKADRDEMGPSERLEWLKLLDQVDYTQFSIDRSVPHHVEGTLLKKNPLTVEWNDGATEQLPASVASVFFPLDPGDNFSAFVKMGKENRTINVERVSILAA